MDEKPYARRRARGHILQGAMTRHARRPEHAGVRRQRRTVSGGRSRPARHPDTHAGRPGRAPQGSGHAL